ncbi:N-acetylmuramidase family protein [Cyanothece sp. BG0011]|uniref:N-acetylmuramidase family protein n=1 Tax=Cyanothece sp. BG0011 TaxID=2082950 RepID=UPI000D1E5372|nr:N-acetylmuramidase family protein [Cyanothece sp. BG0011]
MTQTKPPKLIHWKLIIKFLVQFAIGLGLVIAFASLVSFSSQFNIADKVIWDVQIENWRLFYIVPTYLNLTLAGTLGGLLYSMLCDQTLEFPSWGKNGEGLEPGFFLDIFVGIAGALIAYLALPEPLKQGTEAGVMIFVTGLVGGYGGKYVLDAASQRLIKRIEQVDLKKEKLEQIRKSENLQQLANRQIYQGITPEELSYLQTQLQTISVDTNLKERIFQAAKDARRLGSRVKAYEDRVNRVAPILESLVKSDRNNAPYHLQLACAYRDYLPPRLDEAIAQFNEAIELRNTQPNENDWHYELDRVVALIHKANETGHSNQENTPLSDDILADLLTLDNSHSLSRIFLEFDPKRKTLIKEWLEKNQTWIQQHSGGANLLKQAWTIAPSNTIIKAVNRTYLKKYPIQSSALASDEIVEVTVGKTYPVLKYVNTTDGHYQVQLDHNAGIWYIWAKHWELPWETALSGSQKQISGMTDSQSRNLPKVPALSLRGSVGSQGTNHADDVAKVKQRLKELGFDWFKPGSAVDPGLIQAIKLFQSIIDGKSQVKGDGRIDVGGKTHQWLQAANAPRWITMPAEGKGYFNREVKIETWDNHDYGTNWLSDTIIAAGQYYEDNYRKGNPKISPIPINDVSHPQGGDTRDHSGHECGNACDVSLPRTDGGHILNSWRDGGYDRNATKAMIEAFRKQPLVTRVLFNDTQLINQGLCQRAGGHDNHFHFEVGVPTRIDSSQEISSTDGTFRDNTLSPEPMNNISTQEFKYTYPPVFYGSRQFIVTIPNGYEQKALSADDYAKAAAEFGLEVAVVRAVVEVEASGSGFLLKEPTPARPKILFEAHHFYRLTPEPVSKSRPDLASRRWNRSLYKGGSGEWQRLLDAMTFDPIPALQSASWGLGQVMGFNYKVAGCSTVEQMVVEAHQGEYQQLRHMLNFCKNNNLIPALQNKDWAKFARGYNGPSYSANKYDIKLASSYQSWKQKVA